MDLGVAGRGGARRRTRRRVDRRANAAASAQQPITQPEAVPQDTLSQNTDIEQLEKLASLRDQGILTEEEFQAKKLQILNL